MVIDIARMTNYSSKAIMILMMVKVGDKDNDDDHDARNKDKS